MWLLSDIRLYCKVFGILWLMTFRYCSPKNVVCFASEWSDNRDATSEEKSDPLWQAGRGGSHLGPWDERLWCWLWWGWYSIVVTEGRPTQETRWPTWSWLRRRNCFGLISCWWTRRRILTIRLLQCREDAAHFWVRFFALNNHENLKYFT